MSAARDWRGLVALSVTDPAAAARALLGAGLGREAVWTLFALAIVLNTIAFVTVGLILPTSPEVPALDISATVYAGVLSGGLLITAVAIHRVGRAMGGSGGFLAVLVLLGWLQILRALAMVVVIALSLILPPLSVLASFALGLWGLYILLHFIDQAHGFGSLGRAAIVLIASVLAVAFGLVILLQLAGATVHGFPTHV